MRTTAQMLRLGGAIFFASIAAFAFADNFLRDDGTFQPVTSSSQSVTAGTGLAVSPTPCTGTCTIGLAVPVSVADGGTGNTTGAAHTLPVNEGTAPQGATATGSVGQCLGSGGASADPSFTGGCWVLLATLTANSSASLSDTTHITSAYADYEIVFENLLPTNNNTTCEIQVHSGAAFQSTAYLASINFVSGGIGTGTNLTTYIPCSQATNLQNTGSGLVGRIMVHNPSSSARAALWNGQFTYVSTTAQVNQVGGEWNSAAAVDGFQIIPVAGASPTWASGSVKVYGRL